MDVKISVANIIRCTCALLIGIILIPMNSSGYYCYAVSCAIIVVSIASIIKVRGNWYLLTIFTCIGYSNYSICLVNYISKSNSYFVSYANTNIGYLGINILLFFSLLLYLIAPDSKEKIQDKKSIIVNNRNNRIIVIGAIIVLLLILIYGFTRPERVGDRGTPSALYEYSLIFVIMALYYSGKSKKMLLLVVLVAIPFAIQNFVFGGRITGVQMLILIVLAIFIDRLKMVIVAPLAAVFFVMMSAIGQVRGRLLISGVDLNNVVRILGGEHFALDTAYSSYYTSMTFLDVLQTTDVPLRIHLLFRWILSIFLGGSVQDSSLSLYTRQTHLHYYGGILPYYAWFYLGFVGIILLVLYLGIFFRKINTTNYKEDGLVRCITLYVTVTCLRWYLYSPSQIFRGVLLLCIVFEICNYADRFMKRQHLNYEYK